MTPELAALVALIGTQYVKGGKTPGGFDCWGLCLWTYAELLDRKLPPIPGISEKSLLHISKETQSQIESGEWVRLEKPEDFCIVGLSAGRAIHHVGLWVNLDGGLVIHAVEGACVVAQSLPSLRGRGFSNITFFKYVPSCNHNKPA